MTLDEKLEKFKAGTYVLHVPTKEIWDKLMVELERRGCMWLSDTTMTSKDTWSGYIGDCRESALGILEITEEDFTAPSETVESVMKSIEEVKADLEFYHELFKKYSVAITENLEPTMREKLESLLKKRVVS